MLGFNRKTLVAIIPAATLLFVLILTLSHEKQSSSSLATIITTQHTRHRSLQTTSSSGIQQISPTNPSTSAIAALVPNNDGDLYDFCLAIKSLTVNDIITRETPLLIFHEDDLPDREKYDILKCTNNPVSFELVDFSFPPGFDAEREYEENWKVAARATNRGRKLWGYAQMIRFWTTGLWKHPAIKKYETIMRIDTDSCFVSPGTNLDDTTLPDLKGRYVYRSDGPGTGVNTWIKDLFEFTEQYMKDNNITPSNPNLWKLIRDTYQYKETLPVFGTNFEVNRVSFFLRPDVMKWHEALTEREPFGVFRYRWGDAQTRVLTMALFAKEENVLLGRHPGYRHGRGLCADYFGVPSAW